MRRGIADGRIRLNSRHGSQSLQSRRREEPPFPDVGGTSKWFNKHFLGTIVNGVSREESIIAPAMRPALEAGSMYEWRLIRPGADILELR